MAESDNSEKESQGEMSALEASSESIDLPQKRQREETSEDEKLQQPAKKPCPTGDEATQEKRTMESHSEVNGGVKKVAEAKEEKSVASDDETRSEKSDEGKKKEGDSSQTNGAMSDDEEKLKDGEGKDSSDEESAKDEADEKENEDQEDEEEKKKPIRKRNAVKSKSKDAEVVEGLELSVECASDKASSSSESEDETDKKPKGKTIIVKAKPNESELDASSSEEEKSDSDLSDDSKPAGKAKKGKRAGARKSSGKSKSSDSEESQSDASNEEYSPKPKKKQKKPAANKKTAKSNTEPKKGRGQTKKVAEKSAEKEESEESDEEDKASGTEDKKTDENTSDNESSGESKSGDEKDRKRQRKSSTKPEDDKKIQALKKYVRAAGIHVKSYNDLWAKCKSNSARIKCLKELLEKHGITGRVTFDKCKRAKEKLEQLKDVAELNTSNIISEARVTRAKRNLDGKKEPASMPETPTKQREARNKFKRILKVVDSDSE